MDTNVFLQTFIRCFTLVAHKQIALRHLVEITDILKKKIIFFVN